MIEIPGMNLDIKIHFKSEENNWTGTIDIPVQNIKEMKLAEVILKDDALGFRLPEVPGNAYFEGIVEQGKEKISGKFKQAGQTFPLNMVKESAAAKAEAEAKTAQAISDFTMLVDSLRKARHIVGLGLALVKDDKVLICKGFGEKELGKGNSVDEQTLFAIGSSSKAFTAASLAILADDGKLDWEAPIRNYLPDFKMYDDFATKEMTATDLMCHRSGLPRHDMAWYGSSDTREELYHRIQYLKPNKSFRSTWQYQNFMVMTAGYLAGKINGSTWENLVQTRILDPLGMKNTGFSVKDLQTSNNAAKGYRWDRESKSSIQMEYRNIDAIGPAGSINSNAKDMSAWLRMQVNAGKFEDKEIVSATQIANMHSYHMPMGQPAIGTEITAPCYGLGWIVYEYKGHRVVEHGGNIDGFSAEVFLMPDDGLGIAVLTNQNGTQFGSFLSYYAADMFLDLKPTDWYTKIYGDPKEKSEEKSNDKKAEKTTKPSPIKGTKPSHALEDYTGEYFDPGYGTIVVSMKDKMLQASFNNLVFDVEHWHYDVFQGTIIALDEAMLMNFHGGLEGEIEMLEIALEPTTDNIQFKKMPPARLSERSFLEQLLGTFSFAEGKLKIELVLIGEHKLQANVSGQSSQMLLPWRKTQFKIADLNGYSLEFVEGKNGKFEELILRQPGIELTGKREK